MRKLYIGAGVLLWTVAAVMAVSALIVPGQLPQGAYRAGLWIIVVAFAGQAIHGFLWGSVTGHWATFANVALFFFFSSVLYLGAFFVESERQKWLYSIAMTTIPLAGLLIAKYFRASFRRNPIKHDGYFDHYFRR